MKLAELCESFSTLSFPRHQERAHPARDAVTQFRAQVGSALASEQLLLDCIAHELALIERGILRAGLTPFFIEPEFGVRFAFGYWAPGSTTGPHQHTAWSVSAVCHNQLTIATYDRAESYRRRELVAKNRFEAVAAMAGYIYEPAIHCPMNQSTSWTLSLHISSPRDGEPVDDHEMLSGMTVPGQSWTDPARRRHPSTAMIQAGRRRREADLLAHILLSSKAPRAIELLARCAKFVSSDTWPEIAPALPAHALRPPIRSLARIHPDLVFTVRQVPQGWMVMVEASDGPMGILRINDLARDAFEFAATRTAFEVSALPGDLTDEERIGIADTLEDFGLFKRVET